MTYQRAPDEIFELALARAGARRERDWAEADRLKAAIEAAGWRIADQGTHFRLQPAVPPDVVEEGSLRYGSSGSVPSLLDEPSAAAATVIVVPRGPGHSAVELAARALSFAPPDATAVAVVPADVQGIGDSPDERVEIVRMAVPATPGMTANAGFRRSVGAVVVLLASDAVLTGDIVAPLARVFDDARVAVAGGWGSRTQDLRHHIAAEPGDEADIVRPPCLAFRRDDGIRRGPFDERLLTTDALFAWWSLALRDEGEGVPPRRAVVVPGLPVEWDELIGPAGDEWDRSSRRDFYRLLERYGRRPDLTRGPVGAP